LLDCWTVSGVPQTAWVNHSFAVSQANTAAIC
jgi:hypothetical protein